MEKGPRKAPSPVLKQTQLPFEVSPRWQWDQQSQCFGQSATFRRRQQPPDGLQQEAVFASLPVVVVAYKHRRIVSVEGALRLCLGSDP